MSGLFFFLKSLCVVLSNHSDLGLVNRGEILMGK